MSCYGGRGHIWIKNSQLIVNKRGTKSKLIQHTGTKVLMVKAAYEAAGKPRKCHIQGWGMPGPTAGKWLIFWVYAHV